MSGHMDRLVIVGRDAPLWLAASVVAKALAPAGVMVQAIELPSALTVSDVYASHPALEALHNQLRIDETALLRTTGGAFSLGQNFSDATARVPAFLHAFGGYGSAIDGQDFFGFWLKARRYGLNVPLDDFSLTASAARQGRLLIPDDDTERYARSDYGYHLPAAAYAAYLKSVAQTVGVQAEEASSVAIDRDAATGDVKALMLDGGRRIDGDLFFDLDGALSRDTAEWLDWHQYLPFDRVAVARGERFRAIPVYADERASPTGLTGLYPAQAGTYVVHGWASGLCDDNTALGQMAAVAGMPLMDTTVRTIAPGRLANAWVGNCVALGAAACLLAPLHDLDLLALQAGLVELLGRFPATAAFAAERQDYNRVMAGTYDHLRDFQSLHLVLARYGGTFWDKARGVAVSGELRHRIAQFAARGEVAPWEEDTMPVDSWRALFVGHGVAPETYIPAVDRTAPETLKTQFRIMLGFVKDQVLRQPTHDEYLHRNR